MGSGERNKQQAAPAWRSTKEFMTHTQSLEHTHTSRSMNLRSHVPTHDPTSADTPRPAYTYVSLRDV